MAEEAFVQGLDLLSTPMLAVPDQRMEVSVSLAEVLALLISTTLLVSPWTEGLDLIGLNEPEDEILEQPEQHLPMHVRQGTTCD